MKTLSTFMLGRTCGLGMYQKAMSGRGASKPSGDKHLGGYGRRLLSAVVLLRVQ